MKETISNGCQILSDGSRVWVNGLAGESVARLSSYGGKAMIDVHKALCEQKTSGSECLDCRHDLSGETAWKYFVQSVLNNYKVVVGDEHKPAWAS